MTRGSVISPSFIGDSIPTEVFDPNANAFEIKKKQLIYNVGNLQEERIKLEQEFERISFQKDQCKTDKLNDYQKLLKAKVSTQHDIKKKIEKYAKQETIITKVL